MKLARTSKVVLSAVALAAGLTSVAKAYTTYSSWGTLNVPFYVNPANLDVSASAATSAIQAGMNAWNTQSGTGFRFNYAGQVSTTSTGYDNKNIVVFRNEANGGTIASTYVWTSGGLLRDADIVFWDGGYKFFTGSSGCASGAYIEDIATHELGHAMGLQHSSATDATMYPTYSTCSTAMRSLASDDIAGAQALYANGPGQADTPPTVTILAPGNGATVTTTTNITFTGSATDTTDGNISNNLVWRSNISGQIGTGASFSRTLPAGSHTISATSTDSIGYTITQAIIVTVTTGTTPPANTAPAVTISSPSNGVNVTSGASTTFTGSASDTQQGNLSGNLVWRSNIEGQIGTGASFSRTLTTGTHTVTATVTDSGGLTTQRGITVYVVVPAAPTPPPPAPVAGPTLTARGYKVQGMQKADLSWTGLSGTNVDVYRNSTKISSTANDGAVTDPIDKKGGGSYAYKVCVTGTTTCTNQVSVSF
jgi:hypothetical protein